MISTRVDTLAAALEDFAADPALAEHVGKAARAALAHYGLSRFLADWDDVLRKIIRAVS
ncbi:hypothetical protein [Streptosporangium sp. LJ11]|uniref:hypothetical protein n=1 Tax=Streptosporangium sp. LJ11 TaxID=3436927 RepID=UPI003F793652